MLAFFSRLVRQRAGATAIEYALIAALIALVVITGFTAIGANLNASMTTAAVKMK